jgi:hypothetical protein
MTNLFWNYEVLCFLARCTQNELIGLILFVCPRISTRELQDEFRKLRSRYCATVVIIIRGATALTKLGRLSSRRWQSFPTAPDGTGLTCGQDIESHSLSAFQTGPLLLYSSNYSVYPITRLSGPRSRPNSLRKIIRSVRESNPVPLCL